MSVEFTVLDDVTHSRYMEHYEKWSPCTLCEIGTIARNHVFCRGTLPCDVLFIGEGPGVTEDLTGWPFVGKAGQILDRWVESAVARQKFDYAITNTVLCRPCNGPTEDNRAPTPAEKLNCAPRLDYFVCHIAMPKVMVALGRPAQVSLELLREVWTVPVLNLYHPAYILRKGGMFSRADRQEEAKLVEFLTGGVLDDDEG